MDHFGVADALSKLDAVRDVLTVKRVFGEPYEVNGVTVTPVAAIRGGAKTASSRPEPERDSVLSRDRSACSW